MEVFNLLQYAINTVHQHNEYNQNSGSYDIDWNGYETPTMHIVKNIFRRQVNGMNERYDPNTKDGH